jgi:hypothetical protein
MCWLHHSTRWVLNLASGLPRRNALLVQPSPRRHSHAALLPLTSSCSPMQEEPLVPRMEVHRMYEVKADGTVGACVPAPPATAWSAAAWLGPAGAAAGASALMWVYWQDH